MKNTYPFKKNGADNLLNNDIERLIKDYNIEFEKSKISEINNSNFIKQSVVHDENVSSQNFFKNDNVNREVSDRKTKNILVLVVVILFVFCIVLLFNNIILRNKVNKSKAVKNESSSLNIKIISDGKNKLNNNVDSIFKNEYTAETSSTSITTTVLTTSISIASSSVTVSDDTSLIENDSNDFISSWLNDSSCSSSEETTTHFLTFERRSEFGNIYRDENGLLYSNSNGDLYYENDKSNIIYKKSEPQKQNGSAEQFIRLKDRVIFTVKYSTNSSEAKD